MHADSSAAIGICKRTGIGKVRHLATGQLWVQERLRAGAFQLFKVLGQENLYSGPYFIPFIFMEYDSDSSHCPSAVDVLMSQGYSAFLTTKVRTE